MWRDFGHIEGVVDRVDVGEPRESSDAEPGIPKPAELKGAGVASGHRDAADQVTATKQVPRLCQRERPEAAVLGGRDAMPAELARALGGAGRSAVVTAGSGDATWSDGADAVSLAADPLDRAELDTTGAGDAFAAGFLAARGRGADPRVCLRDGHALAAAACRTTGGRPEK